MSEPPIRLFLITPVVADPAPVLVPLRDALTAAGDRLACVLVRHAARDERGAKALLRALAQPVQSAGAALLVENDARLAAHADLDGVHVSGYGSAVQEAIESLKPERIVGCGGFVTRHDAMTAAEADLDYLMFGEPKPDGYRIAPGETLAWVSWWAQIFNVPCVGFAQDLDQVAPLAAAGADFVALGEAAWSDPRGLVAAVAQAAAALNVRDRVQA